MSKNHTDLTINRYVLPVEIEQEGEFFLATCPAWTDCYAQGNSIDEATSEIVSVASALVDLYADEGLKIPLKLIPNELISENRPLSFDVPVFSTA